MFLPFIHFGEVKEVVDYFTNLTMSLPEAPFNKFMKNIVSTGFLKTLQNDCLKIYPEIYSAEMPMRPVLYLDLVNKYQKAQMAACISTQEFKIYKDIVEVFSRQLILVAGINNIIHRNSFDSFLPISGKSLSSLEKFSSKTLSDKFKYLDDCWYPVDKEVIDAGVRNSIAHNNIQYNDVTQEITYYPGGGGIEQTPGHSIYSLDFMRMILIIISRGS